MGEGNNSPFIHRDIDNSRPLGAVGLIMAYESGELSGGKAIELFQHLIDTGRSSSLHGHYSRIAKRLIDAGLGDAKRLMTTVGLIMAYESGELSDDKVIELFQHLIDTGLAWSLQGHYGRTAKRLIDAGLCKPAGRKS